jgi:RimJ/RimL family protein N-acetyltransferase
MRVFSNLPIGKLENYPGFDHPFLMRRIGPSDTLEFQRIIRDSRKHLEGYLDWAGQAAKWNFKNINQFVMDHVNAPLPREHFVFTLGEKIVALGSLAPMNDPNHIQVALFVRQGFTGNGLAKSVVKSLENYAFEVIGYESVFYNHDSTNRASGAIPQSMGYEFIGSFEGSKKAKLESGLWMCYRKNRDPSLPPGMLQGTPSTVFEKIISGKESTYKFA